MKYIKIITLCFKLVTSTEFLNFKLLLIPALTILIIDIKIYLLLYCVTKIIIGMVNFNTYVFKL